MIAGILLPRSTTHPLIAYNFMDGLHAALKCYGLNKQLTCITASIGFGTDSNAIQAETERLFMEQRIDVLIAFADHPVIDCIFPIVQGLNKLLIVVNHGAKYPDSWIAPPNVIFHNLQNALSCWLTGQRAASKHAAAALVSSYYDGGYSITHALSAAYHAASGAIKFNLIGHQYRSEFNAKPLTSFLKENADVTALLTTLSGELVPELYVQLAEEIANQEVLVYASPVLLEESGSHKEVPYHPAVSGYTSWTADAAYTENQVYCETFKTATGRTPDSFGVLGWDTALILESLLTIFEADGHLGGNSIQHPAMQRIAAAKGQMHLHSATQHYISPLHYIHKINGETSLEHVLDIESVEKSFIELTEQQITGVSSGWLNTYLCS